MSRLSDLNTYLFYEFGFDDEEDESRIADDWPFVLEPTGEEDIYAFEDDGEAHFVWTGRVTGVLPAAGMSAADVVVQFEGSEWIGGRDPIDLGTSYIGHDDIPPATERRAALEALTDEPIAEGLYLKATGEYLALAGDTVIGTNVPATPAPFRDASAWRRLSYVMGQIQRGRVQR